MRPCLVLLFFLVIIGAFPHRSFGGKEIALKFEGETVSARLERVPLGAVIEKISAEKGILFLGGESLLSMEVTASFSHVSFEEGLKRILEGTSYIFAYDRNGNISEVSLVRSSTGTKSAAQQPRQDEKRGASGVVGRKTHDPVAEKANNPVKTMQSGGAQVIQGAFESGGAEPPGGPVEALTPEEMEKFRIEENVPPPGGPVGKADMEVLGFTIIRNAPPPGGSSGSSGSPTVP